MSGTRLLRGGLGDASGLVMIRSLRRFHLGITAMAATGASPGIRSQNVELEICNITSTNLHCKVSENVSVCGIFVNLYNSCVSSLQIRC